MKRYHKLVLLLFIFVLWFSAFIFLLANLLISENFILWKLVSMSFSTIVAGIALARAIYTVKTPSLNPSDGEKTVVSIKKRSVKILFLFTTVLSLACFVALSIDSVMSEDATLSNLVYSFTGLICTVILIIVFAI